MIKMIDYTLLAIAGTAITWFAVWSYRDIVRDKRPVVTEEDIDEAFSRMLEENDFVFDDD